MTVVTQIIKITFFLGASLIMTGCLTPISPSTTRTVSAREDMLILQDENRRLTGRIETLELQMERMQMDLDRTRSAMEASQASNARTVLARVEELESSLTSLESLRAKDRQEIVATLSEKISSLMATAAPSSGGGSGYGYEHVVKAGETLSEIAREYGSTIQAIMKANKINDPRMLRSGQTLFVPE